MTAVVSLVADVPNEEKDERNINIIGDNNARANYVKSAYPVPKVEEQERPINEIDYRPQGGPLLSFLWCQGGNKEQDGSQDKDELSGQQLYLGGEIGCDGNIYCIPGHATRVLVCNPNTNKVHLIGPHLEGKYKWLRGICVGDVIYGLPCHAACVLKIHVPTQTVSTLPIPYEQFFDKDNEKAQQQRDQPWKYHGGAISPIDHCIYAIPQSALCVLKINPTTEQYELVGPELPGRWKWYGGVIGKSDQAIYGIPHDSPSVLRILPQQHDSDDDKKNGDDDTTPVVTLHGDYGTGGHKWHGAAAAPNGDIVSVPANADTVLVIRPATGGAQTVPTLYELGDASCIQTGRHRRDAKYKYLGAMEGTDGMVYCFPSGSERVLQVDTIEQSVQPVGPNLYDAQMERLCQNKWQNGLVAQHEKCVYAIPLAAESLLRIDCSTSPPEITTWPLPAPFKGLAKWEGGVVADNGVIFTIPNNHKAILRIESFRKGGGQCPPLEQETQTLLQEEEKREKPDTEHLPYRSGIPTLRSSAHRVKSKNRKHNPKPKNRAGDETGTLWLPPEIVKEHVFGYDAAVFQIKEAVRSLLLKCDPAVVGSFRDDNNNNNNNNSRCRLEDFVVPVKSTWRTVNGGQCEAAQKYLSDRVASDTDFLNAFDELVEKAVLPYLKQRLVQAKAATPDAESVTFYYQRPPTLRLQPGPAWAQVKAHNDAEYGHQNGELNFWIPLTDRELTGVDLWCETEFKAGDYHPVIAVPGEIISFHGSSCRHYVNTNSTPYTRMSMDFRVGVEGFFDPEWEMRGTTDDHSRREVRL